MKYIITIILLFTVMISCRKEEFGTESLQQNVASKQFASSDLTEQAALATTFTESQVSPKYGVPNSTNYYFQVLDYSGISPISVKLYERTTGVVTYYPMMRQGNYWVLTKQLSINGWYDYRYVYTANNQNISGSAYELCNTRVVYRYSTISSVYSSLYWPFGADGSTNSYRLGWKSSMETGGCGYQWGAGTHTYQSCLANDYYAEDYNRDCPNSGGTADNGAEVRAPIDGQVIFAGSSTGYGNRVDIKYVTPSGDVIVFRIAHLQNLPPVTVNQWVRGGVTKIGNVGSTGNSTGPHAHVVLYRINASNCYDALILKFDA